MSDHHRTGRKGIRGKESKNEPVIYKTNVYAPQTQVCRRVPVWLDAV